MLLIANKWLDTGAHISVRSPAHDQEIGSVSIAGSEEVHAAVTAARCALSQPLSSFERSRLLRALLGRVTAEQEGLARLIAQETGKVIRECRQEVERGVTTLQFSAEEALRLEGQVLPCDVTQEQFSKQAMVVRRPLGVVAAVTPFNFPLNAALHKIGPALAGGNSVVLKPSPQAPLSANRLGELVVESGWPAGWLNIVHGDSVVADLLCGSDVQAINLTGGGAAGRAVSKHAFGKRLLLELGGNDPIILAEDADLDLALPIIVGHRFGSSGQRCTSCKRLFAHESLFDDAVKHLETIIGALVVGDPLDEQSDIGPLISEEAALRIESLVDTFRKLGATIHTGGQRKGAYYWPTLVSGLDPLCPPALDESFGPVLPVYSYKHLSQAITWTNAAPSVLQAGLFTKHLDIVQDLFRQLEVGTLIVNHGPNFRVESLPFGGLKESSFGREGVRFAMQEMTALKTLIW